jgi:hypothetical protein
MVFIDVVVVGLVIGRLLGGRLGALADAPIKGTGLAFAAILLQVIAFPSGVLPWETPSSVARLLWLASYALLISMLLRNVRLRGTPVVALGLCSNLVAILANGGLMPVRRAALAASGRSYHLHNNSIDLRHPHVAALIDRWAVPHWVPLANVFSVGDVLIAVGTLICIVAAMRIPAAPRERGSSPGDQHGHTGVGLETEPAHAALTHTV